MRTVLIQPHFESWRDAARDLLSRRVPPEEILWSDDPREATLFAADEATSPPGPAPKVPAQRRGYVGYQRLLCVCSA